jgi:hypothetical protein
VPIVELGMGSQGNAGPVATWDHAHWDRPDMGGWSASEPLWEEVDTCSVESITTQRGRDRALDRFEAGTCAVTVDDREGALTWGDDIDTADLQLRPGRPLRVRAQEVATGMIYDVFSGFVESITDTFGPDLAPQVVINAQDALAQFARVQLPADPSIPPPGDGELSGARINRLLNLAVWPTSQRKVDTGYVAMQGTDYSEPIADQLGITAESEGGAFYATKGGNARFRDRYWLRDSPESANVQATIGAEPGDLCAASYEVTRDGADIVNDVQYTRVTGVEQRAQDARSISLFRRRSTQRQDFLCETDTDVMRLANRLLQSRSAGRPRIPSVELAPLDAPEFDFVLRVEFGWRLLVRYDAGTAHFWPGTSWNATVLVQGIAHKIDPTGWTTTLRVDDASAWPAEGWDHNSGWDVTTWAVAL